MSKFPEISPLFAALASNLRASDLTTGNEVDASISKLNRSLNPSDAPRVRILDTALSLMHFSPPQVHDSAIEFTLKSIVTVLLNSIECEVVGVDDERILRVGGLMLKDDCARVMEDCAHILEKLDGTKGDLCDSLLYNILRVAALAPCFPHAMLSDSNLNVKGDDSITSSLVNLICHIPNQFTFKNGEIPLRLLIWHLDPMILKQDITQVLREIIKRPFLSLKTEMYNRLEWRSKIICLVISPSMCIETRAFLHKWFLTTGLTSLMEFQSEIVVHVLDILSRPIWWGISMEVGSKLPFSSAYFPFEHQLLRILAGPISQEQFKHLLERVSGSDSHAVGPSRKSSTNISLVDHKSLWALVMNFPDWFFFASMMIFCNNNNISGYIKPCMDHELEVICPAEAAKFIAWILYPMSEYNQCLMVDYLVRISDLWSLKCSSLNKCHNVANVQNGTKKLKLLNKNEPSSYELDCCAVSLWLKEFRDIYIELFGSKAGFSTSDAKGFSACQNLLSRRIPLGILLLHPSHLNAEACSLLLHYAVTGTVRQFSSVQNPRQSHKRWNPTSHKFSMNFIEQYTKAEATAGCRTVFDITDVADRISHSLFTEKEGPNFVCEMKAKICSFLLQCINRLLGIELDEDDLHMRRDLLTRVIRWRHQGKDGFQNHSDLDCICEALNV